MSGLLSAITWDIDPIIFELGKLQIRYYGLLWGVGIWAAYITCKKLFVNEKEDGDLLDPLLFACMTGGIVGARLGHVIFYQSELFTQDFLSVFLPFKFIDQATGEWIFEFSGFAGLASHGGAAGVIIALVWYKFKKSKRSFLWILDKVCYPIALTAFFIRIANFMNSEIVGNPTGSDFGVIFKQLGKYSGDTFVPEDFARHPSQLYEAIAYLFIFLLLSRMYWKGKAYLQEGKLLGTLLITMFTARFFIEFTKNSQGGIGTGSLLKGFELETGQWLSLPFIAIGAYLLFRLKKSATVK